MKDAFGNTLVCKVNRPYCLISLVITESRAQMHAALRLAPRLQVPRADQVEAWHVQHAGMALHQARMPLFHDHSCIKSAKGL